MGDYDDRKSVRWAVICGIPGLKVVLEYDDEEDARAHLPFYPEGYLARCEVTQTPWERVTER